MPPVLAAWLPVAVWMALIFAGSTDLLAASHTSRFLGPLLHWLAPGLPAETVSGILVALRKLGHVSEYAVLSLLVWRAAGIQPPALVRDRPRLRIPFAWLVAVAYAVTDEYHQSFVPSREGRWLDVAVDAFGAAIALTAWSLWIRRKSPDTSSSA